MVLPATSKNQKIIFLIIFILCLFVQIIPVIRSGLNYNYGIGFWGPNGHDGIWHLSLINHISNPIKIDMPVFAGEALKNYHPFFDILIAYLSKITFIDSSIWLFQLFPIISASLFLYFSFLLGRKVSNSYSGGLILMILNAINNSFGWIVTLIRSGSFNGESLFWAMQSPSNQLNPPFALSILLLIVLIYLLKSPQPKKIIIFLILILLPIIKVYSAVPAFIIFAFYVLKNKKYISTFVLSLIFATLLFFQYNSASGSLIKFQPFWFTNSMIESVDRFYWPELVSFLHSSNILKFFIAEIIAIIIFIVGNFAFRLIAFKEIFRDKAILFSVFVCFLIPTLFIQNGTSWNTIQFLYYALFLANIPLSLFLSQHKRVATFIIIISLLPLIGSFPNWLGKIPPTSISNNELSALNFLKNQVSGTVLTYPYDAYLRNEYKQTPLPIYAYETSSYVAAYSRHLTFIEDEMNLENSGFDWRLRRQNSTDFFAQKNQYIDRGFLVNNQIDYIYLPKIYVSKNPKFIPEMYLENVYENPEVIIYKVKR
ncbi:MAG: hypothetical protein US68_C0002G0024 [Candidatus Shapirobacteria bacterium GW2011_GWE1_38_10]|uniref:Glycosyltransferase RgtA/B/C/D-like domain-containing protein n=1 Tax=Candidatus Shapirobacteria bacterium GW2011_GWE1_38_10 TaxID=1618488 RepID=A0A0G0I8A2_9BACT|nr:MAG: hypothetical protein US46_C0003G0016 [Candidatus Shapirobacteria bacterium GW2011_GWF2_37_20]KKQ50747.1 MAG: hypothetical protein US68_C0002G0024 [Candidatus Shapirobacteria bacterium GW2011_GWE1_38_10]KKQ64497.1 MAG: hypothetical protein US85_C0008G0026 [Candidatus Shapirobacteria bacterium GW2011_GWF1_38_23]HBP51252.1 hypothetical protein [Candidatus Shapirobacteria bacterium]